MKNLPTDLSKNERKEIGGREQKRGVRLRLFGVGKDGILQRSSFGRTADPPSLKFRRTGTRIFFKTKRGCRYGVGITEWQLTRPYPLSLDLAAII